MNLKNILRISFLFLCASCFLSCSDNDDNPISLHNVENNSISLIYPSGGTYSTDIVGGDGNYSISCSNNQILEVSLTYGQTLVCKPLSVGGVAVTIMDKSNNSYTLNVKVSYVEHGFVVVKHEVVVMGDNLTIGEKKEIEAAALASILAKPDGGYRFIYSDEKDSKGHVYIYSEKFGDKSEEGTFERTRIPLEGDIFNHCYKITTGKGRVYNFIFLPYNGSATRSSEPPQVFQFCEDVTEAYKSEYVNLEQVYTSQVILLKRNL